VLVCSNVEQTMQWLIKIFDCKQVEVPEYWDNRLPSDVALGLPGDDEPTILLNDEAEVRRAGFQRENEHPSSSATSSKAYEFLSRKGAAPGPMRESGARFFEVREPGGIVIEVCEDP
jgi:hypothetical protein